MLVTRAIIPGEKIARLVDEVCPCNVEAWSFKMMRILSIHRRTGERVLQSWELLEHELVIPEVIFHADLADVLPKRFLRREIGKDPLP